MITIDKKQYFENRNAAIRDAQKQNFASEAAAWRQKHGPFREKKVVSVDEIESRMNNFLTNNNK